MATFIIWLIGYVLAYYLFRFSHKTTKGLIEWGWGSIAFALFWSVSSWMGVFVMCIILLSTIVKLPKIKMKPPKWL